MFPGANGFAAGKRERYQGDTPKLIWVLFAKGDLCGQGLETQQPLRGVDGARMRTKEQSQWLVFYALKISMQSL